MSFRAFISLDLTPSEQILDFCRELEDTGADLRMVDPELMHITMKFLGNIEESTVPGIKEVMIDAAQGIGPQRIDFQGVGAFPRKSKIRVVWVGISGADEVVTMANRLEDDLTDMGFKEERHPFKPHLTVARTKGSGGLGRVQKLLDEWEGRDMGEDDVSSLRLKKSVLRSEGPTYHTVEEIKLEG